MKKWMGMLLAVLLLTGCGAEETMETVADELALPAIAQPRPVQVDLPGEAAMPAVESSSGRVYICQDYEIVLQTFASGDLSGTVREISGHELDSLSVMQTGQENVKRYEFVWAAAGETGDQLGQAVILDDGNYHYTMTVTRKADPAAASQVSWSEVFESFRLG